MNMKMTRIIAPRSLGQTMSASLMRSIIFSNRSPEPDMVDSVRLVRKEKAAELVVAIEGLNKIKE